MPFVLFGPTHLVALALTVIAPLALAGVTRVEPASDRLIRLGLAMLLTGGWLCWFALFAARGWLTPGQWPAAQSLRLGGGGADRGADHAQPASPMSWVISGAWAAPCRD